MLLYLGPGNQSKWGIHGYPMPSAGWFPQIEPFEWLPHYHAHISYQAAMSWLYIYRYIPSYPHDIHNHVSLPKKNMTNCGVSNPQKLFRHGQKGSEGASPWYCTNRPLEILLPIFLADIPPAADVENNVIHPKKEAEKDNVRFSKKVEFCSTFFWGDYSSAFNCESTNDTSCICMYLWEQLYISLVQFHLTMRNPPVTLASSMLRPQLIPIGADWNWLWIHVD